MSVASIGAADVPEGAYVLDVREPEEWDAGHTPGAHHVPMSTIPARLADIPTDEPVVVLCRHGHRSAQVVNFLSARGLDNTVNLDGGIVEWVAAGRPIVTDDGRDPYVA
ncbi:MAG TPA: rhodanese-like domain-containing protein [Micromonosporaceae bacterium]|nr:rhodanese-like domain-containing protein [Micromonosporaceae bacterium]